MGQTGARVIRWLATCALALSAACGPGGGSTPPGQPPLGPPVPADPGARLGTRSALTIGPTGGTVTVTSDGTATVSVPAGALATEVDLTVEVITNTAPSAVGNAYRVEVVPADTVLAAPVALVFTPPPGSPALETLALARQDENGYWVRQAGVTRDPAAGTLTVTTTQLGDWAIVGAPNGRDLIGVFDVVSTVGASITASGKSSLNFHWGDPATGDLGWYVQSGRITAAPPITRAGQTCTPAALTMRLAPNVASLLASPTRFRWAVDGRWEMTCGSSPDLALGLLSFDTSGVGHLGCARRDLETPIVTAEKLQGRAEIDCSALPGGGTVTASWRFEICNEGQPCPPSSVCHTASITCDTGLPLCVDDGNLPNGTTCDVDLAQPEVCGDGVCNVCRAGVGCEPRVCHVGAYTCDTGFEVCTESGPVANGTTCDVDPAQPEVCGNGTCNVCRQDAPCGANPNRCVAGRIDCATGFEVCVDTAAPIAAGTACDVNGAVPEVCNGSGGCVECWADQACSTNQNECVAGVTSCASGGQTCEDTTTAVRTGETCDEDVAVPEVCFNGVCNACTAGEACTDNPNACVQGVTSCTTGQRVCVDTTTAIPNGTSCGTNQVCNAGVCTACTAGLSCETNPNTCVLGTTSCTTGTEVCADTGIARPAGTTCGTNQVCTGPAGAPAATCVACTENLACSYNSNPCVAGVTSCASGRETCEDTAAPIAAGTACDVNPLADEVCSGTGSCVACTANLACADNSNECVAGVTSCATGARTCENTTTAIRTGETCDENASLPEVCFNGVCSACTAGTACATNPNECVQGVTSCTTGQEACVDTTTAIRLGQACETDPLVPEVCDASGACSACTADASCTTNSNPCFAGATSCATGVETCEDRTQLPNGTSCGTNLVCFAGTCGACTPDVSCSTNPNPCVAGRTDCSTGVETCVDTATPIANGTTCGTDQVCSGGACVTCVAGLACEGNPDACRVGNTSCATGTSACVDTATLEPNGTSCGTDLVCNAGSCLSCVADQPCEGNPTACLQGKTSCATGTSVCVDSTTPELAATSCGPDQVCDGAGVCNACVEGADCTPSGACTQSLTSCATGVQTCVDTFAPLSNGTTCGTDLVCASGVCSPCSAGDACTTNPNACVAGVTSCATGTETCEDTTVQLANGTSCGTDAVCSAGVCSTCVAGGTCDTNPNPCAVGTFSCATGAQACVDTVALKAPGTECGAGFVCTAAGVCESCIAGASCTTNPSSPCTSGVTSCTVPGAEGTQVCVDGTTTLADGTGCGTDQVCSGGVCSACTAGVACDTNPDACRAGVTSCVTGTSQCVDGPLEPNGTACGADAVCNAGLCSPCVAGGTCSTNPNPCVAGTFSCATGTQTCVDTATPLASGTSCGTDQVCSGGACVTCVADVPCEGNPDACLVGATSCATGTSVCVNTATLEPNGASCGANLVCSGGSCVSCTEDLPCEGNPTACLQGKTSCATGTQTCVDSTIPEAAGTACGTGHVCSGTGTCNACVAGLDCTAAGACTQSLTACDTGVQTCVETGAPLAAGTSCGTDLVCDAGGVCSVCSAGDPCSTNPTACVAGVTSCATGAETCLDTATQLANGTSCGADLVCNAGSCVACQENVACDSNTDPCRTGVTSCDSGASQCVNTAIAEPNGTPCGAGMVCNAGTCVACVADQPCTDNPTDCRVGKTSCVTGTETCVDTATLAANGTACDVDPGASEVCYGGACSACTAGNACTTNPNPCVLGATSCATGLETCADTLVPAPDGASCGTNLVCSAGACTACVAGVVCTPAGACTVHETSCATGTSVCTATATPVADGTVCGTDQVCSGGACAACVAGAACTNPGSCWAGTTSCSTGTSTCLDSATPLANGTSCGADQVCNAGSCVACTAGAACASNPDPLCHDGVTSCATGTSTCLDAAAKADGTSCGTDLVCSGGACVTCVADAPCTVEGSCFEGRTSCATGTSVCQATATPLLDGASCGASSLCQSGACVPVRNVTGARLATHWTTTGTCTAAAPCTSTVVAPDVLFSPYATVSARPTAGGTWDEIPGTFSGDGSFSIPDVPAGPYQLVLVDGRGVVHVIETDSSDVDLGYDVLGRSDAALATSPANVGIDLTGLTPWLAEDEVEATAFDVDVFDVPVSGADVGTGQTTGGVVEDWGASSVGRALNALTAPDVLHLHQLSTETATDGVTAYAYQRATVAAATLNVATPAPIAAALAPVTDTGTLTVSWDPEAFEALLAGLGPSGATTADAHRLLVETAPYASLPTAPVAAYGTPGLFRMVRAPGGAEVLAPISLAPITYGRFLDVALASEWRRAELTAAVSYEIAGAAPLQALASIGRRDRMPSPPIPIVPAVGPVQSPLVAGQPALGALSAPGLTPAISWTAPAIGTPTRYEVRLHRLYDGGGVTAAEAIRTWHLPATAREVRIPPGLLTAGTTYFAEITALLVPDDAFAAAPLRRGQVFSHATTLTSPFTP